MVEEVSIGASAGDQVLVSHSKFDQINGISIYGFHIRCVGRKGSWREQV